MYTVEHNLGTHVTIKYDYDDMDVEGSFDFGNDEENKAYLARFNSGELSNIIIFVKVYDNSFNVCGEDILGGCHIRNTDDILATIKEYAMIDNAKLDLAKQLHAIKTTN